MKKIFLILFLVIINNLFAIKNWNIYTNTTHIYDIEHIDPYIYIASWGGLEIYNTNSNIFERKFTTINGLVENDIQTLDFNAEKEELLLGTNGGGVNRMVNGEFVMPINEIIGLASDFVNEIVHNDSMIYVASKNGLSVFSDDPQFPFPLLTSSFNSENGLSENNITSLMISESGYIYCGSTMGVDYVHKDSISILGLWMHLNTENSILPSNVVTSIAGSNNYLAVATDNGVLVSTNLNDPAQTNVLKENLPIYPVYIDNHDNLWLSYGIWKKDLHILQDTLDVPAITKIPPEGDEINWQKDDLFLKTSKIKGFKEINEQLCAYTWGEGLYLLDNDDWSENLKSNGIMANLIADIEVDMNNKLWVSNGYYGLEQLGKGTKGVCSFDGNNWEYYTNELYPELKTNNVYKIHSDNKNNKWFVCWQYIEPGNGGVTIFNDETDEWQILSGNPSNYITNVVSDEENRLWISYIGGVSIAENDPIINIIQSFQTPFDPDKKIMVLLKGKERSFFGTFDKGLEIWNDLSVPETNGSYWEQTPFSNLHSGRIFNITSRNVTGNEEIWIASAEGLFMFDGEDWFWYGTNIKKQVWQDNDWFWNENVPDPEYWYYEGQERLYGSIPTYPTALFVDPFGLIWIGTQDAGITVFNKERDIFTNLTTENTPLISNNITAFAYEPLTGTLYIGTSDGLNSVEIGISAESNTETILYDTIAYPNPFYPDNDDILRIENESRITMPRGDTICNIYDLSGELILKLEKDIYEQFSWDGTNKAGKKCSSGIYFYIVSALGGQVSKGKIILIR